MLDYIEHENAKCECLGIVIKPIARLYSNAYAHIYDIPIIIAPKGAQVTVCDRARYFTKKGIEHIGGTGMYKVKYNGRFGYVKASTLQLYDLI